MKYRLLGKSGLRVSEAALGTMTLRRRVGMGITEGGSAESL
jgi:aryl-alcohol dehydrogenase-like predicted oxidoreductase